MQLAFIMEQVVNGLFLGAIYLLIALGLSLIFSLGGIVNLAHGAFYAIGAYLAVVLTPYIGFGGSLVASPVLVGLLGIVIERFLFRRFYRSDPILSLLLTFGLAMVAEQALRMIFGAPPLPYSIPTVLRGQIFLGDFLLSRYRLAILIAVIVVVAAVWFLLQKTPFGRVVRHTAHDRFFHPFSTKSVVILPEPCFPGGSVDFHYAACRPFSHNCAQVIVKFIAILGQQTVADVNTDERVLRVTQNPRRPRID